jgi:hypothetical protein
VSARAVDVAVVSWWQVALLVVVGATALVRFSIGHFRRGVRERFVALVRERRPDWQILHVGASTLGISCGDRHVPLPLTGLYHGVSQAAKEEAAVLELWLRNFDELVSPPPVTAETLLPRLVTDARLRALHGKGGLPSRALGDTGLHVIYVFDGAQTVRFVQAEDAAELALDEQGLFQRACANLESRAPGLVSKVVAACLERPALSLVKSQDTYDASRLLLVAAALPAGRRLVAVIPDRDTLGLAMEPGNESGWESLRRLARTPEARDQVLLDRPVVLSADGVSLA